MARDDFYLNSAVEAIGNTPLVELSRITHGLEGRILAKLEYLNPGFSKKDRIARQMIEEAEEDGRLKPGQTVVELTSGNTGTGLAIVCGIKGYPFVAVMSRGNSPERARMMSAFGAEVILVDQLPDSTPGQVSGGDLDLVEQKTREIVEKRKAFRADQFLLQGNYRAHYLHTGPEIIQQSKGAIDAFCDFVGSGGTFSGCAAAFKEYNPSIQCFVVEPEECAVISGREAKNPNHPIQGGGYSKTDLLFLNHDHIDGFLTVTNANAMQGARLLAKREGIFAGFSSGANISAALKLLGESQRGKTIAITINDAGLKYLSTNLWD
jgi:cysteine synthase A